MKQKVRVTGYHIDTGKKDSLCDCAIGLALQEVGVKREDLEIDTDEISIGALTFYCPPALSKFQKEGMDAKPQKPFTLDIAKLKFKRLNPDYAF